jgi:hypothetical protein
MNWEITRDKFDYLKLIVDDEFSTITIYFDPYDITPLCEELQRIAKDILGDPQ